MRPASIFSIIQLSNSRGKEEPCKICAELVLRDPAQGSSGDPAGLGGENVISDGKDFEEQERAALGEAARFTNLCACGIL